MQTTITHILPYLRISLKKMNFYLGWLSFELNFRNLINRDLICGL